MKISETSGKIRAVLLERAFFGDSCEWLFEAAGTGKILVRELGAPQREVGKEYFLDYDREFLIPLPECGDEK